MEITTPKHGLFKVSKLIFGCGAVGGLLINGSEEEKQDTFDLAIRSGINWFDTAPTYGDTRSESALGILLTAAHENIQVSTKVTIDTRDPDYYGQVERSLTSSLKRLNRDQVTLIQLHNPIGRETKASVIGINEVMKPHGVLDAFDNMKMQGLAQHIGITGLGETPALIRIIKSNRLATIQLLYNLLNASAGISLPSSWSCYNFTGLIDTCFEHDVAVFGIRAFAAGILATEKRHGREQPLTSPDTVASEEIKQQHLSQALYGNPNPQVKLALRFALSQPRIDAIIIGLAERKHLEVALEAEESGPLDAASLKQIQQAWGSFHT
ncbi:MAG: hypothetical protein HOL98_01300 [Gammaproteobacteria bacterium]|nr:hypothetical protein [Gammaproteobacteria bacterium]MBT5202065.1 hypothetical protein [Gammaproteobacteria bacterium]MBT5603043.1 hypothetical protein [Gammaproteobacteria bacterium]MBT6245561.1 hypothetical protein [Gammaproteobacteria bacterium]